jgi:hypothetical protein
MQSADRLDFDFWTQGGAQNPDFKPKRDTEVVTLSSMEIWNPPGPK